MLSNLTGWHFLIILVVILLLFGAPKLPGLARSLGQSMKIFKSEIAPERTEETKPDPASSDDSGAAGSSGKGHTNDTSGTDSSGTAQPKD
jgi:sec-independent protein translocase protein TatA